VSAQLAGKVAVITGGGSGVGRSTVHRFLAEGARVVVADLNEASGKQVVAEATDAGHGDAVQLVRADVSREDDVVAMLELAVSSFDRLDVVFNNAGFAGAVGPITHIALEDWNETIDVLLGGVFLGTKHAARIMRAAGSGGSIINTASVAGVSGGKGPQAYTAAKHAVIGLTRATALELAPDLIRVNAICPGAINTPLLDQGYPEETGRILDVMQPWPQHGRGDDIAAAALYLASGESRFVTGQSLVVDGGLTVGKRAQDAAASNRYAGMTGITRGNTGQETEVHPIED